MELIWHNIAEEGLPEEFTPKYCKDEHTESVHVLVWDSFYGPSIDRLWNGEWVSDKKVREGNVIEPAVCHTKIVWAEIPPPDFVDPMVFKKIDSNGKIH